MDKVWLYIKLIYRFLKGKFLESIAIKDGTDSEGTVVAIKTGIRFRGSNVWILICAAMLASIGLDVGSSAVIIGAMLISPLMNPILGIGLGIGISDRTLLVDALKNFGLAVVVSLVTSALYFTFTPLGMPTSEMIARTTPTLLDVGVAVFGGVAGIVANSRKEKTNAIPGVAIATALMPPLCTAGYGIAKFDGQFFFGAFYLFFINAVFISLSTYLIVRLLDFPYVKFLDHLTKVKIQRWIAAFALVVMIPSGIIFWNVVSEARMDRNIQDFIKKEVNNVKYEAIRFELMEKDTVLKLFLIGEPLDSNEINRLQKKLKENDLDDMRLRLVQMNVPESERDLIKNEVAGEVAMSVLKQVQLSQEAQTERDKQIDSLKAVISSLQVPKELIEEIRNETRVLFEGVESVDFGLINQDTDSTRKFFPVAILKFEERVRSRDKAKLSEKFNEYIQLQFNSDSVIVVSN